MTTGRGERGHALLLAVLILFAGGLRVVPVWHHVFSDEGVRFQGTDAWYHARLLEVQVANYPWRLEFDPLAAFPEGQVVWVAPLLDFVTASLAKLAGGHMAATERIAAFVPPVLACLGVLAVYSLARRLFDRTAALFSTALLGLTPGPFLQTSVLGRYDHHVLEALLASLTLLAWIAALEHPGDRWRGLVAGAVLALYLMCWSGGALLVFALTCGVVAQIVTGRSSASDGGKVALTAVVTALLLLLLQPWRHPRFGLQAAALVSAGVAALAAVGLKRSFRERPLALASSLVGLAGAACVALVFLAPDLASRIQIELARFTPTGGALTIGEIRPLLLSESGDWSLARAWTDYHLRLPLFLAGLILLSVRAWGRSSPGDALLLAWGLVSLAATLGQNRFGYYLAPNAALLGGFALSRLLPSPGERGGGRAARLVPAAVLTALVLGLEVPVALGDAARDRGPVPGWTEATDWLRERTPAPFPHPDFDRRLYVAAPEGEAFAYPPEAYGVMAWWDYGYLLLQKGRRIPVANPAQTGAGEAARFFTAVDESEARAVVRETGTRYVLVDHTQVALVVPTVGTGLGKFGAMVAWAGRDASRFFEVYRDREGKRQLVYYPDYYQSMFARLYLFGGAATEPENTSWVIRFEDGAEGATKRIVESWRFRTHAEAATFLEAHDDGQHRLVGLGPSRPCVPVSALGGYRGVFDSRQEGWFRGFPAIRIFEVERAAIPGEAVSTRSGGD